MNSHAFRDELHKTLGNASLFAALLLQQIDKKDSFS